VSFPMALNTFNLNTFKLSVQVAWPSPGGRKDELRHLIRFLVRRPRAVIVHAAALGRHYVRMPTVVTSILADLPATDRVEHRVQPRASRLSFQRLRQPGKPPSPGILVKRTYRGRGPPRNRQLPASVEGLSRVGRPCSQSGRLQGVADNSREPGLHSREDLTPNAPCPVIGWPTELR
jgi:hypothetical protein